MAASLVLNRRHQVPAEDSAGFGAIAERFRRAGELERAVALCQEGLRKYPKHLSSRVTLGWALLDLGRYEEARVELEQVMKRAPDNLAAIRGLAQLHDRTEHDDVADMGDSRWAPPQESLKDEGFGDEPSGRTDDLVASLLASTGAAAVPASAPVAPESATMSPAAAMRSAAPDMSPMPAMQPPPAAPPRVYNEPFAGTMHESFAGSAAQSIDEAIDAPPRGHLDESSRFPATADRFEAFDAPLQTPAVPVDTPIMFDAPLSAEPPVPAAQPVMFDAPMTFDAPIAPLASPVAAAYQRVAAFDEPTDIDPPMVFGEAIDHTPVSDHRPFSAELLSPAPFALGSEPSAEDLSWDEPEPFIDARPEEMDDAPMFSKVEPDTPVPDEGRLGPWPPVFDEDLPRPAPALRLAATTEPSAEWPPAERLPPPPPDSHFSTVVAKPVQKGLVGALSRFSRRVESRRRALLSEYKAG